MTAEQNLGHTPLNYINTPLNYINGYINTTRNQEQKNVKEVCLMRIVTLVGKLHSVKTFAEVSTISGK